MDGGDGNRHDSVRFDTASGTWLLTGHSACVAALSDRRFSAASGQAQRRRSDTVPASMLNTDPPDHRRLRAPVARLLSRSRLDRCAEQVKDAARHYADQFARAGGGDALAGYAAPVATVTLQALLGIPPAELLTFARLARAAAVNLDPLADPQTAATGEQTAAELDDYLRALVLEQRATAEGMITALADDGELSLDEQLATLGLFVIGGFEPLVHLIGNGLYTLLQQPGLLDRLRREPHLWPTAVDELLRWESPIPFTARVCTAATTIGGRRIEPGQTIVTMFAAANRDPGAFPAPEVVDPARSPNPMLAFGAGVHSCLAAPAARLAGRIALTTAVRSWPRVALTGEPVVWRASMVPRGLVRLPLRLE